MMVWRWWCGDDGVEMMEWAVHRGDDGGDESGDDGGDDGVWFHDLVDSMSQDIVDTCSGGVHGSCPLCR